MHESRVDCCGCGGWLPTLDGLLDGSLAGVPESRPLLHHSLHQLSCCCRMRDLLEVSLTECAPLRLQHAVSQTEFFALTTLLCLPAALSAFPATLC